MERILNQLNSINESLLSIGEQMRLEGAAYRAELEERQKMGLHGEAAVKHYNDFMDKCGMSHLKVK